MGLDDSMAYCNMSISEQLKVRYRNDVGTTCEILTEIYARGYLAGVNTERERQTSRDVERGIDVTPLVNALKRSRS